MTTRQVTRELAEYIVGLTYDDLPAATVDAAKGAILDHLGIMLTGSTLPWTRPTYELAAETASRPEATIVGQGTKVSVLDAAMVNSNYSHSCEFDDTGYSGGGHSGSIAVPAALAIAESRRLSGQDLILGVVAGYEVLSAIGKVFNRPVSELGFHPQSFLGPFGAAAVAAKLLRLPSEQVVHALSIAGSHSSGTMEYDQRGGEVKRFHSAMATRGGLVAALLAQKGLTGPDTILEGKRGLARLFARLEDGVVDAVADGLDDTSWFAVQGRTVKPYPTVGTIHTSIQAVDHLAREHGFDVGDVAAIDVFINPHALLHGAAITKPQDTIGAQFSLAFSLGLRLVKGSNELRYYMDPDVRRDPEVLAVGELLEVHGDQRYVPTGDTVDWDRYFGARARIRLHDGREWEHEEIARKGSPNNPLTQDELEGKFRSLAAAALAPEAIDAVIAEVGRLDQLGDVSAFVPLLVK